MSGSAVLAIQLKWIPWTDTIPVAIICGTLAWSARRFGHNAAGVLREMMIICALYSLWGFAGEHADLHMTGATRRALDIWRWRHWVPLPDERTVQQWVLPHHWLVYFLNGYYAAVHIPSLVVFLVWLFVRHRDAYPRVRNVVAITTGTCLAIQLIPVAPPRLTPGLGFVDTAARFGPSVYPAVGTAGPDQFSAMPSVHIAWATIVAVTIVLVARSRWRWLALGHLAVTFVAVVATGNHWWLDGFVAWLVVAAAVAVDGSVRAAARRARSPAAVDDDVRAEVARVPA